VAVHKYQTSNSKETQSPEKEKKKTGFDFGARKMSAVQRIAEIEGAFLVRFS